ncbi:MAG: TonB-dependent receptor [Nibricoccus sp.]
MNSPTPALNALRQFSWKTTILFFSISFGSSLSAATIQGVVSNQNTRRSLERAVVKIPDTPYATLTDSDGSFRLSGLPEGTYTLVVEYTDLERQTRSITVGKDESTTANFELTSDLYELDAFVVSSTAEGTAFAINQQRRAESARSVTSVDAFIDQSTGNPGEFLRNISGIQMSYSQNEPNRIGLRGQDPTLTSVTMDGNEIASAASSGTSRVLEVDQLSLAAISSVEVYKAPIPSMSANAIGGAVNLVTKSAFDQKGQHLSLQLGVMTDSNDFFTEYTAPGHNDVGTQRSLYPVGRLTYSNSFLNNRLGLVFSVGRDETNMLGSSASSGFNIFTRPPAPTVITPENSSFLRNGVSFAPNRMLRTRTDYSLNTDFKLTDAVILFFKSTYSEYHSTNRQHAAAYRPPATLSGYTADSTLTNYATAGSGTASQSVSVFDKHTRSWQLNPGLKFKSGEWKVDLVGGFSKSTNHYHNPNNFSGLALTTLSNLGIRFIDHSPDSDIPSSVVQTAGSDMFDLDSYYTPPANQGNLATEGQRTNHGGFVNRNVRDSSEVRWSGRLDVQRDFHLAIPFYVKTGLSYNETIRNKTQPQRRWYWMGDDGIFNTADDNTPAGSQFGRFAEPIRITSQIPDFTLREPEYISTVKLFEYWQAHPQVLVENLAYAEEQKFVGKRKVDEEILGGYLMGNATIKNLNVLLGVRVEQTDIVAEGSRTLPTSGPNNVLPPGVNANSLEGVRAKYRYQTTYSDYLSDPFPYVHLRYEVIPSLQLRSSYTEGIGRPDFTQILPSLTQNDTPVDGFDGTITSNRAGLLPQRSKNYDLSIEYYTKSAGEWSASWFRRDIDDYISSATIPMTPELLTEFNLGPEFANYRVSTNQNLGNANWSGFEVSVRQKLRDLSFVPKFLSGVEIWANYTGIYEMEGKFTGGTNGATITHLANVVDSLFNAGISYRSRGGKFYVHLKTNFQAGRPTANVLTTGPSDQTNPRQEAYQFWDMETSYRLTSRIRFTCTARNLASERPEFTTIGMVTNKQQATGIQWFFGMNYDL